MRKKSKSRPLLDDRDFPISMIRRKMVRGTGRDIEELKDKPLQRSIPQGFMGRNVKYVGSAPQGAILE